MTSEQTSGSSAAFFDLDRTLIAGSSTYQFARAGYKSGLISRKQAITDAWHNVQFRINGSSDEMADELRLRIRDVLAGVPVREVARLTPAILAGILPRVYPEMLKIAYGHQDQGRPIYICTAAAQEIAELIATVFVFDGGIGSQVEVVDGCYTGRSQPFTYREGKAVALREFAAAREIDLTKSWAYSDSESDLPMLRAVGHPVAVNPDRQLLRVAVKEGWQVLHFEKLRRNLEVAIASLALVGGLGSWALSRRRFAANVGAARNMWKVRQGKSRGFQLPRVVRW